MRENICLTAENVTVFGRHTYGENDALLLSWPLSGFTAVFEGERAAKVLLNAVREVLHI